MNNNQISELVSDIEGSNHFFSMKEQKDLFAARICEAFKIERTPEIDKIVTTAFEYEHAYPNNEYKFLIFAAHLIKKLFVKGKQS